MPLKTQSYSISISSKVTYKSCIVSLKVILWIFFMLYLQAVKRSHRRLGLAQKLMEQVLSSCCFYYCKIFSCIILKHYYKLFVWKILVHRCLCHSSFIMWHVLVETPGLFFTHFLCVCPHKFPCIVTGCKENHFYSLPFGQAEASIY